MLLCLYKYSVYLQFICGCGDCFLKCIAKQNSNIYLATYPFSTNLENQNHCLDPLLYPSLFVSSSTNFSKNYCQNFWVFLQMHFYKSLKKIISTGVICVLDFTEKILWICEKITILKSQIYDSFWQFCKLMCLLYVLSLLSLSSATGRCSYFILLMHFFCYYYCSLRKFITFLCYQNFLQ